MSTQLFLPEPTSGMIERVVRGAAVNAVCTFNHNYQFWAGNEWHKVTQFTLTDPVSGRTMSRIPITPGNAWTPQDIEREVVRWEHQANMINSSQMAHVSKMRAQHAEQVSKAEQRIARKEAAKNAA